MYTSEQTYIIVNQIYQLLLSSQTNEYNRSLSQAIIKCMDLLVNMESIK